MLSFIGDNQQQVVGDNQQQAVPHAARENKINTLNRQRCVFCQHRHAPISLERERACVYLG